MKVFITKTAAIEYANGLEHDWPEDSRVALYSRPRMYADRKGHRDWAVEVVPFNQKAPWHEGWRFEDWRPR